jgi:hypothetical protein
MLPIVAVICAMMAGWYLPPIGEVTFTPKGTFVDSAIRVNKHQAKLLDLKESCQGK